MEKNSLMEIKKKMTNKCIIKNIILYTEYFLNIDIQRCESQFMPAIQLIRVHFRKYSYVEKTKK